LSAVALAKVQVASRIFLLLGSIIARSHQPQSLAARELAAIACLRQTLSARFHYSILNIL
jgi:hypothetical protein